MTGAQYGNGIDVAGLIKALEPLLREEEGTKAIALSEEGLSAAEGVVLARYWMIQRVYWHRTNRAIMAMHKYVISDLVQNDKLDLLAFMVDGLYEGHREATKRLSDIYDSLHKGSVTNPLHGLFYGRRAIYKRVLTKRRDPGDLDNKELFEYLRNLKALDIYHLTERLRGELNVQLAGTGVALNPGDLIMEVPIKDRDKVHEDVLVHFDRGKVKSKPLSGSDGASYLLREMDDEYGSYVKKARIFVSAEIAQNLKERDLVTSVAHWSDEFLERVKEE